MTKEVLTELPETVDTILSRRSIRSGFIDTPLDPMIVDNIIECGLNAPSSKNAQPWKLHIVENRLALKGIAKHIDAITYSSKVDFIPHDPSTGKPRLSYTSTVSESAEVLKQVPLGVFIENTGKFTNSRNNVATADRPVMNVALIGVGLEYIGLGASIQNMWLAAQAHGLRGVFMGDVLIAEEHIKDELGMEGDLVGVLALGYSDALPTPKSIQQNIVRHE
jgi:nitroreductase